MSVRLYLDPTTPSESTFEAVVSVAEVSQVERNTKAGGMTINDMKQGKVVRDPAGNGCSSS